MLNQFETLGVLHVAEANCGGFTTAKGEHDKGGKWMVESHTHSLIRFIGLRLPVCLSDLGWNHQELPSCEPN